MRIACYHNQAPGGARRAIHQLCCELARRHTVDVFSPQTADETFLQSRTFAASINVYPFRPRRPIPFAVGFNMIRWFQDLKNLERLTRSIAADIDSGDYDVVITDPCRFIQAAPSVLPFLRTPGVYYCHEPPRRFLQAFCRPEAAPLPPQERARAWLRGRLYDAVIKPIDRRNAGSARAVLANSLMTQRMIKDYYGRDAAISPLGVDAEKFRPADMAETADYVFSVGALAIAKGFDFIVRALRRCPQALRPRLVIAANADDCGVGKDLRRLADRNGIELEILIGISDEEVLRLYQGARAFVFASHYEPFGLAVLEAMACARPVVAVAEGGPCETVIDGVTGFLAPRDEDAFARALTRVLGDPGIGRSLGKNARLHVESHWTWQVAGEKLEATLASLAGEQTAVAT